MKENFAGNIHFIGVGGISMSALAEILLNRGCSVSGSDRNESYLTKNLQEKGMRFCVGHNGENITEDTTLVVYTVAVKEDNPELVEARRRGITTIPRSKLLGEIMEQYKYPIAVSGTHGKTTTTSMLAYILTGAELDPTILVGGGLDLLGGTTLRLGKSEYILAEACEYYRSFLDFKPFAATVLNVEPDHLDYYKDKDDFQGAFEDFAECIVPGGVLIACSDDEDMWKIIEHSKERVITYGIKSEADVTARDITYKEGYPGYKLVIEGEEICPVQLSVTGQHNVINSLAALANAWALGLDIKQAAVSVGKFKGAMRRFEYKFDVGGAKIFDDYAHHPTEVKATVQAANKLPHNKLVFVFQPHTYSRTKIFKEEFATAFKGADEVIVADIYAAREPFDPTISSEILARMIKENGTGARAVSGNENIAKYLKESLKPGDIAVVMGAGDIFKVYDLLK